METSAPGVRPTLPRWMLLALVPYVVLAACALYLSLHWNRIPQRYPVHWGAHGPNGWSQRSFLGVFSPLIFAAGLATLLLALGVAVYRASQRSDQGLITLKAMVGVACVMGVVFSGVGLLALGVSPTLFVVSVPILVLGLVVFLIQTAAKPGTASPPTPGHAWKPGGVYYNPGDPKLLVPKRFGIGYTFNFAHKASWLIVAGFCGGMALLVAFLVWALHAQR